MRYAFTIVELIFVIIILALLAAFALPRLATSRDDANFIQVLSNTKQLMIDVISYNTSQAKISNNIRDMTNVIGSSLSGNTTINGINYPQFIIFNAKECYLKFVFTNDARGHVVIKLDSSITVDDCKILNRNHEFENLKNSEYPISSKVSW
nr:prepilin-type N-terminal cleavage/methylation domain-containing protein [uncultured Campylobacter sp.]